MKIDFIISALSSGGAERVAAIVANSLAKNYEHEISVITFYEEKEEDYHLDPAIKRIKLSNPKFVPNPALKNMFGLIKYYKFKENRPDIIISFITLTNLISIIVAKLFSIKIIAQEHNSHLRYMEGRKKISNFTKKHVYKMANVVTLLTSFDIEFYNKHGVNTYVMPNPCSFTPIIDNKHKREKSILAVGNLTRFHHKGFDNLIKLIAPILKKNPDWKLKIAGTGDGDVGLNYLKQLAKENHILDKIEFIGFIKNIAEVMIQSSIFILPSRFEGLPMVLLEAMSQGMACIAYDCKTGPSDIIEHNINGLLIEDQNMIKMQHALNELIINESLRQKLSENGIKSLDKYHISNITKRYENLILKIVNNS
ncbi:glycosyltransferase family 4 protein [Paucihalobacter ruber]|uniref:Glycosyltransferase family 4 protein n=1 Tax=Paucihalobacter ruber TaxID=2567861 RepID=A0A506PHT2_9FLAO|nr:glycosyltransferase family 4 protein [Paucihalobacter ruber]TPV33371.1 glycosyltransferase family 4 protein [Paucihalobacter ruber]